MLLFFKYLVMWFLLYCKFIEGCDYWVVDDVLFNFDEVCCCCLVKIVWEFGCLIIGEVWLGMCVSDVLELDEFCVIEVKVCQFIGVS